MLDSTRTTPARVLLVDLNNFSRFPTLPVGLMAAVLRREGHEVEVLSPFAVGVPGLPRAARAKPWGYWDERLRWWSATTPSRSVRNLRRAIGRMRPHQRGARSERMLGAFEAALDRRPAIVLISSYLMYHEAIERLCARALARGIPVVLGGPAFHEEETRRGWLAIPGLTGVFAGEAEGSLQALLSAVLEGAPDPPGFSRPGLPDGGLAEPLADLDALPFPDYADFPWDRYPNRIVSMLTARGCGWGVCKFCSDVVTVSGRTYRSRSLDDVLGELAHHRERHATSLFCFSDLKLNSDLALWRGLHERFAAVVPDAKWTCAVHVGPREDEGLRPEDLRAARAAGLVRITTGLESGSRRLLDSMRKGTAPERLEEFLAAAHAAGISTRMTAFTGYPGEEPTDVDATTRFLERSGRHIERVHLSRLLVQAGTPLEGDLRDGRLEGDGIEVLEERPLFAETGHVDRNVTDGHRKRSIARLLRAVHAINRRPVRDAARELEGAM